MPRYIANFPYLRVCVCCKGHPNSVALAIYCKTRHTKMALADCVWHYITSNLNKLLWQANEKFAEHLITREKKSLFAKMHSTSTDYVKYGNRPEKNLIKLHNRRLTLETGKTKHVIANCIVLWANYIKLHQLFFN